MLPWFKDWSGQAVLIVASGPSAKKTPIHLLKDKIKAIAIKENIELCPWADVVYGCDAPWWRNALGLPDFRGLKVSYAPELKASFPDINLVGVEKRRDELLFTPGTLGAGGNSGFQALNLAVQFGAKRILLVGFDMHDRSGVHWYGRANGFQRHNPDENNFRRWRIAFANAAPQLKERGIDVVNASPISELRCFRRATIEKTMSDWGL